MARRRRGTKIEELIGPVVVLIFLLIFWANGFNIQRTTQMMQGLFALIVYGVITIGVCIILFFVIRYFVRKNRDFQSSFPVRSRPALPVRLSVGGFHYDSFVWASLNAFGPSCNTSAGCP